ncbi:MAG: hypothetical protein IJI07_07985 [Flexilinea sp.]|nr:hypothetical protein [Flexilinea sp.]
MGKRSVCLFILLVMLLMLNISAAVSAQVNIPNIPAPVIPTPFVPNIPAPVIPTPFVPNIPDPLFPNIPTIQPKVPTIQPNIPTQFVPNPVTNPLDKPVRTVDYRDFTYVTEITPTPKTGKEGYDEAMAFFREEKYYSAWKAFTDSQYEDWNDWADKCPQEKPDTGETWHDPDQWLQDMELTIRVDQSPSSDMFFRIYKEGRLISNVYISGSDEVTVKLPGNADYTIKDGIGRTWYGEKEAFGKTGSYETMTFDEKGTETVYLKSGYAYTLSINVSEVTGGTDVDSKDESWENFSE